MPELLRAECEIVRQQPEERNRMLQKAADIILALRDGLNFEHGQDIALTLQSLYDYNLALILQANVKSDSAVLKEAVYLMSALRDAWQDGPVRASTSLSCGN